MKYKNQHWIPESYLKAWCDSETPDEAWLWRVSLKDLSITRKSPKSLFSENDFYTAYDKDKNRVLTLEHELQIIESNFVNLRNNKIKKKLPLNQVDRKIIAIYTAAMYARTKRQKEDGRRIWEDYIKLVESLPSHLANRIKNSYEYKKVVDLHKDQPMLFHIFQFINITAPYLSNLNCAIYETKNTPGVITSDNPCLWLDPEIHKPNYQPKFFGIGSPTLNVIMPISPKQFISLEMNGYDGYKTINSNPNSENEMVNALNRLIVLNSDEFIVINKNIIIESWFKD